jgi:hypothetical protein
MKFNLSDMLSLKDDTLDVLSEHHKNESDIETILFSADGCSKKCSFDDFIQAASNVVYSRYTGVDDDLYICGHDGSWWLERCWIGKKQYWQYKEGWLDLDQAEPCDYSPTPSQLKTA